MILQHKDVLTVQKINLFLMAKNVHNVLKINSTTKRSKDACLVQLAFTLIKNQKVVNVFLKLFGTVINALHAIIQNTLI